MDKFFFSPKNIDRQASQLGVAINAKRNPESQERCHKIINKHMKDVYGKYGNRKPNNMSPNEFIDLLNKKSIKESISYCKSNSNKSYRNHSTRYTPDRIGDLEMDRVAEIEGQRDNMIGLRPTPTKVPSKIKREFDNPTIPRDEDGKNQQIVGDTGGGFAPFLKGEGEYINAFGEMGSKMPTNEENFESQKSGGDDLIRRMNELQMKYDGGNKGTSQQNTPQNQLNRDGKRNIADREQMDSVDKSPMFGGEGIGGFGGFDGAGTDLSQLDFGGFDTGTTVENIGTNEGLSSKDMQSRFDKIMSDRNNIDYEAGLKNNNNKNVRFDPLVSPHRQTQQTQQTQQPTPQYQREYQREYQRDIIDRTHEESNYGQPRRTVDMNNEELERPQDIKYIPNIQTQMDIPREQSDDLTQILETLNEKELRVYTETLRQKLIKAHTNTPNVDLILLQTMDNDKLDEIINKITANIIDLDTIEIPIIEEQEPEQKEQKEQSKTPPKDSIKSNSINPNVPTIPTMEKHPIIQKQLDTILIVSADNTDKEYYNDYIMKLPKVYNNVASIKLSNAQIPKPSLNITQRNNTFTYNYFTDGESHTETIEIDEGNYDIDSLISILNGKTNNNIMFKRTNTEYIQIRKSTNSIQGTATTPMPFELVFDNSTILKSLGFSKSQKLQGENSYKSFEKHKINPPKKIWLFVENADSENPLGVFDFDSAKDSGDSEDKRELLFNPKISIDHFNIKFKTKTSIGDYESYNFGGEPHELTVIIEHANI